MMDFGGLWGSVNVFDGLLWCLMICDGEPQHALLVISIHPFGATSLIYESSQAAMCDMNL